MARLTGAEKVIADLMEKRLPTVKQCSGVTTDGKIHLCSRTDVNEKGVYCKVYAFPSAKWRNGDCPMADDELRTVVETDPQGKVRVGQQKQKKKSRR